MTETGPETKDAGSAPALPTPTMSAATSKVSGKPLSPAAERALAEAEARRAERARAPQPPKEISGRGGLDPTRYGDWEVNGVASDF